MRHLVRISSTVTFAALFVACGRAIAQTAPDQLPPDSRVRALTVPVPDVWQTGNLTAWSREELDLQIEGGWTRTIPVSDLTRLQFSRGEAAGAGEGA